ncbi:MAG: YhdH/YhfP family quinone oxidoreductase [Gammaproteobacteria bacterium]|nr:YhdH/YhfP family quinone oxidoreductase [Gammaproteobacteria bacterium]
MTTFRAYEVSEIEDNLFRGIAVEKKLDDLPAGEVLVKVSYSSLNYKDALSASGNKGVTRNYPHTPGIDVAGVVKQSSVSQFMAGDSVIVSGYDLGMNTAGGFAEYIRVPAAWVLPLPEGLDALAAMQLGTAGFTAAFCLEKLLANGLEPDQGEVLVTGATGGVGIIAVMLLAKAGFQVAASTGKLSHDEWLRRCGASTVLDRSELVEASAKPLLEERWAGAVDVVGGDTLFNVIKSLQSGGSVTACGLVQSPYFQASVLPFILRGVNLLGIDSVELPLATKQAIWQRLAGDWKLDGLNRITTVIGFGELEQSLTAVLQGGAVGRFVFDPAA